MRREVLQQVGGFAADLRLVEDLDAWLRIARAHPIGWCGQECLLRRRHTDNISRDAEAMAFAYLEVLHRHRRSWTAAEAAAMEPGAGQLASRKFIYLAELAINQGRPGAALKRVWHSVVTSPRPQTLWRITKSALKLILRRDA